MTKGRAALVLAVFVAAIAANGQVAAQAAQPDHQGSLSTPSSTQIIGTTGTWPDAVGAGTISGPPGTKLTAYSLYCCSKPTSSPFKIMKKINGKAQKGDECPSRNVRLRLVHGSTVITESGPFPVGDTQTDRGKHAIRDLQKKSAFKDIPGNMLEGAWVGTLDVPPAAGPFNDTVQASCDAQFLGGGDYTFPTVQVTDGIIKILPQTGFTAWPWTLLGAALLTIGAALLGAGRRRAAPESA